MKSIRLFGLISVVALGSVCCGNDEATGDTGSNTEEEDTDTGTDSESDTITDSDSETEIPTDIDGEVYILDDGVIDNFLGVAAGGDMWWANRFNVADSGEQITVIQVAIGQGLAIGSTYSVHVYEDPNDDGEPYDMVLLTSESGTVQEGPNPNLNEEAIFEEVILSTPVTVEGAFFIAALITHTPGQQPLPLDNTQAAGQSWVGGGNPGAIDPNDVYGTTVQMPFNTTGTGFPGNVMIRAVGVPASQQ